MPALRLRYARSTCGAWSLRRRGLGLAIRPEYTDRIQAAATPRPAALARAGPLDPPRSLGPGPGRGILCEPPPSRLTRGLSSTFRGGNRSMRVRVCAITVCLLTGLCAAAPAEAQYGARRATSNRATGETYGVEVSGAFWNPSPDVVISSEQFGQIGSNVDFVNTLGITETTFKQLRVVLRPGTKHKFRFEYTPLSYDAQKVITAEFTFNGQKFQVGIPVTTNLEWKAYRFGYEWDFVYKSRGFVGLLLDLKYTDLTATLTSPAVGASQFTHARAPIPAIGIA